jgi:hypothetical protein
LIGCCLTSISAISWREKGKGLKRVDYLEIDKKKMICCCFHGKKNLKDMA